MFRIPEFFVEDKDLPKVLHALTGVALNMGAPQAVTNAVVKSGKVKAKKPEGEGSNGERVVAELKKLQLKAGDILRSEQIHDAIKAIGVKETNFSPVMHHLKNEAKFLKITDRRGVYTIL